MSGNRPETATEVREGYEGWSGQPSWMMRWYSWDSPVGLGLFFILVAVTIFIVRAAFR